MNIRIELHGEHGFSWGEIDADDRLLGMRPYNARPHFIASRIEMKMPAILEQYDDMKRTMEPGVSPDERGSDDHTR